MSKRPPAAEQALVFECQGEQLLGLLHLGSASVGVVMVVGGPQYRAGSHRFFVQQARALAAAGCPVLRFDARGMGDSSGALRDFEQITPDIGAAIDALVLAQPQVRAVVLWGLCDAASAALIYLAERPDARVRGLCLLNPWVRSATSLAQMHVKHYYWQRLKQPDFWRKLFGGRVARDALEGLWGNLRAARKAPAAAAATSFQQRMLAGWQGFDGASLLVLSGKDYTAQEFVEYTRAHPAWLGWLSSPGLQRLPLPQADHTVSSADDAALLAQGTLQWLQQLVESTAGVAPSTSPVTSRATSPASAPAPAPGTALLP